MKPRLEIRALRPDERQSWEPLWQGYLTFYKSAVTPDVTWACPPGTSPRIDTPDPGNC
jgi:hypothetical protein